MRLEIGGDSGCWDWLGNRDSSGYGSLYFQGRLWSTHRLSYTVIRGPISDGLHIDHLCRNRACCNPWHMEAVTQAENTRRGKALITHCPKGHPYDEANTRVRTTKEGWTIRRCRACFDKPQRDRVPATHCKRGHPLSGENIHVSKDGRRHCRACGRETMRLRRANAR